MEFRSIYAQGFARVAALALQVHDAQPERNARETVEAARRCARRGAVVAVFPELGISGYAIDDLLLQDALLDGVRRAIATIERASAEIPTLLVVGAPLRVGHRLYNCAVAIARGRVLAVVPKCYPPTYREFYEKRHFAVPGPGDPDSLDGVPFGPALLEVGDVPGLVVFPEVCEDMWVPVPPSALGALAGATLIANLSASPITVGRAEDRRLLVRSASARCDAAYLYTAAGAGESTTDLSWDGQTLVYEMGDLLAEGPRFASGTQAALADVDLDRIRQERQRQGSLQDNRQALVARGLGGWPRTVSVRLDPPRGDIGLLREVARFPFVPGDPARLQQDCYEAYNIQVSGLERRLTAIGRSKAVIGVSGGLDSTHALIVAAKAMDRLGRPRSDVLAFTLPGFATSQATRRNATELARRLGVTFQEIDIRPAARRMLADLGHPAAGGEPVYDVTFENVQAGLRTDYLFRLANQRGGIVVGTGDLSELALGWCTYGVGDQMSHYAVNSGVPKTLIQHLIRWVIASHQFGRDVDEVLGSILDTEISPELVPQSATGAVQSTESKIGPYNLHDFTLFYALRWGYRPSKIAFLAEHAWSDAQRGSWPAGFPRPKRVAYTLADIVRWERVFYRRFFASQFKRTAIPNGPKVVAGGSLSPRGDWRMPSDASADAWLAELDAATRDLVG